MSKLVFHPNAYIPLMRNKKSGLKARTEILNNISRTPISLKDLRKKTKLSPASITYHLKILEKHRLIQKSKLSRSEVSVKSTELGQKIIRNYTK